MKFFKITEKQAFTLAEVLITLGIIGVVAAMTIPTLIKNYQKDQTITQLKKTYSMLSTAIQKYAADSGCIGDLSCTGTFSGTDYSPFGDAIASYLKLNYNCKETPETEGSEVCFARNTTSKAKNGVNMLTWNYKLLTLDGVGIAISDDEAGNCVSDLGKNSLKTVCGKLAIDLNGPKLPNQWGKDTFEFFITKSGNLYPNGGHDFYYDSDHWDSPTTLNSCSNASNSWGQTCAGRIMEKGWKIDYD